MQVTEEVIRSVVQEVLTHMRAPHANFARWASAAPTSASSRT